MYRMRILVNGRPIPIYTDKVGNNWVEARENSKFEIKVENNTFSRVLAVLSVDGLNVINGKHQNPDDAPGYIIANNNSISIPGWTMDPNKTREFIFTTKDKSFAGKVGGDLNNTGVIGCAIYPELIKYTYTYATFFPDSSGGTEWIRTADNTWKTDELYCSATDSNSDMQATTFSASNDMAVGSGDYHSLPTEEVQFERALRATTLLIYYDNRESLIKNGIIRDVPVMPMAFPNGNYCPDVRTT